MDALTSGAASPVIIFNAFDSFKAIAHEKSKQCKNAGFYRVIREGNYTNFPSLWNASCETVTRFHRSSKPRADKEIFKSHGYCAGTRDSMLVYPLRVCGGIGRKPNQRKGAYTFAAKTMPVLPCFITMEDSDIPR